MRILMTGWQIVDFGSMSSVIFAGWCRWRSGQRWRLVCCPLSVSLRWRCTHRFEDLAGLQILCRAILARIASVHLVLMKHCAVSSHRSLHLSMPMKHNSPLLLFSIFSVRLHHQILRFLHHSRPITCFGHFGHIQGKAHVGLLQLCPTSLPCHSSRQVKNLLGMSRCFEQ